MAYPSYYNPYVSQFVQPSPMANNNNMVSKVVDSLEMVRSADIPMDGQMYYFPKADGSVVYGKKWLPNCTTQIMAYIPQIDNQTGISSSETVECLQSAKTNDFNLSERMDSIESKIDNIEKILSKKAAPRKRDEDESKSVD